MTRAAILLLAMLSGQKEPVPLLHPVAQMPSFSVTSVRPMKPGDDAPGGHTTLDTWSEQRFTVREMIAYGFGLGYDGELSGGPSWMYNERYAVQGKLDDEDAAAAKTMSRDDQQEALRLRVQTLLKDRFHLQYHFETKTMPVYRLQIAKSGLLCKRDLESKSAITDPSRPRFRMSAPPPPPPPPPDWHEPSPAEMRALQQNMHMRTRGWPFWLLVAVLGHQSELGGRPVIDETGLDGPYDCDMVWSREGSEGTNQYLFEALQTQMGLRLAPSKGLVEVLVVDSIDRPSEN